MRAAPLLLGHGGSTPVDVAALEDLLARLARLADDVPEVAALELNPVVAAPAGAAVLGGDRPAGPARPPAPSAAPGRWPAEPGGSARAAGPAVQGWTA